MDLCKLARIAQVERFGSYDYAVPMDWLMQDPEKRRPHFWWYSRKSRSLFGRPLKWAAVARLALRMLRRKEADNSTSTDLHQYMEVWRICHPGKPLDAFGESLVRAWLDEAPDKEEYRAYIVEFAFHHMDVPPPQWLVDMTPDRSASQAA